MTKILLFSFAICFSGVLRASERDLGPLAKELVFKAIIDHVYLEQGGRVRAPQKISDFNYKYLSFEKAQVTGSSYSFLDGKTITYKCDLEIIGRGIIESVYDFEIIHCDLIL